MRRNFTAALLVFLSLFIGSFRMDATITQTDTVYASIDSYLDQGNATTNYETNTSLFVRAKNTVAQRSVFYFDLSYLPSNATITAVSIQFYTKSYSLNASPRIINLQRLTSGVFSESKVTWNKYTSSSSWSTAG